MKLSDIVRAQVVESDKALAEARDRFQFLAGWNAACQQILTQLPSEENTLVDPKIELVPELTEKKEA